MSKNKFRKRLFGYKKSDVYDYIRELDAQFASDARDKDCEITRLQTENANLAEKYDELQSKREIIVSVLEKAHMEASEIIDEANRTARETKEEAQKTAIELRRAAEAEIEDKKAEANREIELKRRALRNMYEAETRRIEELRGEVTQLRANSLEAIKSFERELYDIEEKLGYRKAASEDKALEMRRGGTVTPFEGVKIPIKVIRRKNEAI